MWRYCLNRDQKRIAEHFEVDEWSEIKVPLRMPRFNIAPTQVMPAVRLDTVGKRELVGLQWGLVPHWTKDPNPGFSTINARAETVAEKPAFRDAFRRRRSLIPSDSFYEWQAIGKRKQPWLIHLKIDVDRRRSLTHYRRPSVTHQTLKKNAPPHWAFQRNERVNIGRRLSVQVGHSWTPVHRNNPRGVAPRLCSPFDPDSNQREHPGYFALTATGGREVFLRGDGQVLKPVGETSLWER